MVFHIASPHRRSTLCMWCAATLWANRTNLERCCTRARANKATPVHHSTVIWGVVGLLSTGMSCICVMQTNSCVDEFHDTLTSFLLFIATCIIMIVPWHGDITMPWQAHCHGIVISQCHGNVLLLSLHYKAYQLTQYIEQNLFGNIWKPKIWDSSSFWTSDQHRSIYFPGKHMKTQ